MGCDPSQSRVKQHGDSVSCCNAINLLFLVMFMQLLRTCRCQVICGFTRERTYFQRHFLSLVRSVFYKRIFCYLKLLNVSFPCGSNGSDGFVELNPGAVFFYCV